MSQSIESIRSQMQNVRGELHEDVDDLMESTREMTDWHSYFKRYPWLSLGAAIAAGFVIVPKRVEMVTPDPDELLELAKRNKLVVKTNPKAQAKSGVTGMLLSMLANAGIRAAVGLVGQQLSKQGPANKTPTATGGGEPVAQKSQPARRQ